MGQSINDDVAHEVTVHHEYDADGIAFSSMEFECLGGKLSECKVNGECWISTWFDGGGIEAAQWLDESGSPVDTLADVPEGTGRVVIFPVASHGELFGLNWKWAE